MYVYGPLSAVGSNEATKKVRRSLGFSNISNIHVHVDNSAYTGEVKVSKLLVFVLQLNSQLLCFVHLIRQVFQNLGYESGRTGYFI